MQGLHRIQPGSIPGTVYSSPRAPQEMTPDIRAKILPDVAQNAKGKRDTIHLNLNLSLTAIDREALGKLPKSLRATIS